MSSYLAYIVIISVFLAYFAVHSLMASIFLKQWVHVHWPGLMPYYRLTFNALAIILAIPLLLVMYYFPGETLWQWQGVWFYISTALALLAVAGFVVSLRYYDLSEFWGTRQLQEGNDSVHDQEGFHISHFHRYVRHPWYFFALVIIWTRDVSTTQLLVYFLVTVYFVLGSLLEERKLIAYHGKVYRKYQHKVAGIIPLPWKILSAQQARELLDEYQKNR